MHLFEDVEQVVGTGVRLPELSKDVGQRLDVARKGERNVKPDHVPIPGVVDLKVVSEDVFWLTITSRRSRFCRFSYLQPPSLGGGDGRS